jgi:hypothetical protein
VFTDGHATARHAARSPRGYGSVVDYALRAVLSAQIGEQQAQSAARAAARARATRDMAGLQSSQTTPARA